MSDYGDNDGYERAEAMEMAQDRADEVRRELAIAEAQIAKWIRVGAAVDYCSVIGEPPTRRGLTVRSEPYQSSSGHWVVFLNGHSGFVSVLSVQPTHPDPRGDHHE